MKRALEVYVAGVLSVVERADILWGKAVDVHSGHGVVLEEIDEFWEEVRKKESDRDTERLWRELVDIGAACVRWARCGGADNNEIVRCLIQTLIDLDCGPVDLHAAYSALRRADEFIGRPFTIPLRIESAVSSAQWIMSIAAFTAIHVVWPKRRVGVRRLCAFCRAELPGSDPLGGRENHGICAPVCSEAYAMGWRDAKPAGWVQVV